MFNWIYFLLASFGKIVKSIQTSKLVAFLLSSIYFYMFRKIIDKDEEIILISKAKKVNRVNKVNINKKAKVFYLV